MHSILVISEVVRLCWWKSKLTKHPLKNMNEQLLRRLQEIQGKADWWEAIKADASGPVPGSNPCFLAVRTNSIEAYYHGGLVADIRLQQGEVTVRVNRKFLFPTADHEADYVELRHSNDMRATDEMRSCFNKWHLAERFQSVKRAAALLAGPEKEWIHRALIERNPNILDLEIAEGDGRSRIDLAAVRGTPDSLEIVHYEVKHVSNPQLFPGPGEEPAEVVEQLTRYDKLIAEHGGRLKRRYRELAKAALELELSPCFLRGLPEARKQHRIDEKTLTALAKGEFQLSPDAVLVVLGLLKTPDPKVAKAIEVLKSAHKRSVLTFGTQGQGGISKG